MTTNGLSRRQFLRGTGVLGAGLFLPTYSATTVCVPTGLEGEYGLQIVGDFTPKETEYMGQVLRKIGAWVNPFPLDISVVKKDVKGFYAVTIQKGDGLEEYVEKSLLDLIKNRTVILFPGIDRIKNPDGNLINYPCLFAHEIFHSITFKYKKLPERLDQVFSAIYDKQLAQVEWVNRAYEDLSKKKENITLPVSIMGSLNHLSGFVSAVARRQIVYYVISKLKDCAKKSGRPSDGVVLSLALRKNIYYGSREDDIASVFSYKVNDKHFVDGDKIVQEKVSEICTAAEEMFPRDSGMKSV